MWLDNNYGETHNLEDLLYSNFEKPNNFITPKYGSPVTKPTLNYPTHFGKFNIPPMPTSHIH